VCVCVCRGDRAGKTVQQYQLRDPLGRANLIVPLIRSPKEEKIPAHCLINGNVIGGGVIEHKMCGFICSPTFVRGDSHSKKNSATCYHRCTYVFM
jgi:hypothetical protein